MFHRTLPVVALIPVLALVLSACSSVFLRDDAPATSAPVDHAEGYGPPLPADATVESAGARPAREIDTTNLVGSLRPVDEPPEELIPEIVERGRVIIGVDQSQYLLSYRDSVSGDLLGFEIDLSREISRDIFGDPNRVEFRFVDSSDRVSALESGDLDLVIRTMSVTHARQQEVLFSTPYLSTETRLLVMQNSGIDSFTDLPGQTVCVADNSTALQSARQYAPHSPILKVRNWADCLVALQQHQADAVVSDGFILSGISAQDPYTTIVGGSLTPSEYAVAAARPDPDTDTTALIRQVNSTLERIREDGTWWRMYDRWFSAYLATSGPPELHYRDETEETEAKEPQP
ncbi:glutamate ABC transporter substrate-binding protein [Corynebacterium halotolerans]|uniref:glutamate ABC transporter substrate-binding protein n=1 Tax=Corynebacterium halotolerans TaxID=225326 RepID=UPI003CF1E021